MRLAMASASWEPLVNDIRKSAGLAFVWESPHDTIPVEHGAPFPLVPDWTVLGAAYGYKDVFIVRVHVFTRCVLGGVPCMRWRTGCVNVVV